MILLVSGNGAVGTSTGSLADSAWGRTTSSEGSGRGGGNGAAGASVNRWAEGGWNGMLP